MYGGTNWLWPFHPTYRVRLCRKGEHVRCLGLRGGCSPKVESGATPISITTVRLVINYRLRVLVVATDMLFIAATREMKKNA